MTAPDAAEKARRPQSSVRFRPEPSPPEPSSRGDVDPRNFDDTCGVAGRGPIMEMEMRSILKTSSDEHTSVLQSLMRISYAVCCLRKRNRHTARTRSYLCSCHPKYS